MPHFVWLRLAAIGCRWLPLAAVCKFRDGVFWNTLHAFGTLFWKPGGVFFTDCQKKTSRVTKRELGLQELIWDRAKQILEFKTRVPCGKLITFL